MKKTVSNYISELLYTNECVIIADFGGFIGNISSAKLNKNNETLSPPSKDILFNRNLNTNDGLLIAHIAEKENITNKEARDIVRAYVNDINAKLNTSKILRLESIGLLTLSPENKISFVQDKSTNYNVNAFGMHSISSKYVKNIKEEEKLKELNPIQEKNIIYINKKKILLKAAAIMLPLFFISYITVTQEEQIGSVYKQMAELNPFKKNNTKDYISSNKNKSKIINENNAEKQIIEMSEPIIIEEKNPVLPGAIKEIKTTYYIIGGAFNEKLNAERMLKNLIKNKYKAEIIKEEKILRVSYNSFINKKEALLALKDIRKENSAAWLLTK